MSALADLAVEALTGQAESLSLLLRYAEQNEAWKAEPGTLDAEVWGYLQRVGVVSEESAPQEETT